MKQDTKKEIYKKILLIGNNKIYVENEEDRDKFIADPEYRDINGMIASGEFDKAVKRSTLKELKERLNEVVESCFASWFVERTPEMQPIMARLWENEENIRKTNIKLSKKLQSDLSDLMYRHPGDTKKLEERIAEFRKETDKAKAEYDKAKAECYTDATDILYDNAYALYIVNHCYSTESHPELSVTH